MLRFWKTACMDNCNDLSCSLAGLDLRRPQVSMPDGVDLKIHADWTIFFLGASTYDPIQTNDDPDSSLLKQGQYVLLTQCGHES
jgi:hypothetical protein